MLKENKLYAPIIIAPSHSVVFLCKAFHWIVLLKENKTLRSSDLQFGFKEHAYTTQCTFAVTEVFSYHNSEGIDVFVVVFDATKAFDRTDFCKLFRKLLDRNMPPLLLILLLYMYTNQNLHVRWGSMAGTKFGACNGVKQGAVLSPFCLPLIWTTVKLQNLSWYKTGFVSRQVLHLPSKLQNWICPKTGQYKTCIVSNTKIEAFIRATKPKPWQSHLTSETSRNIYSKWKVRFRVGAKPVLVRQV